MNRRQCAWMTVLLFVILISIGCMRDGQQTEPLPPGPYFAQSEQEVGRGQFDARGGAVPAGDMTELARQVIHAATLSIKVPDFVKAQQSIKEHIEAARGFVARSEQRRESNDALAGTMVLRVPVANYDETLSFLQGLGKVYELSENAEDATDRVVDLQARLNNARRLEQRILSLLEKNTGSIADIIEAERQLADTRARIEEMEGRFKRLKARTDFAAFTVHLFVSGSREVDTRTWYGPLLQDIRDLGFVVAGSLGALLTVIVAVLPWIPLAWWLRRWFNRRKNRRFTKATGSTVTPPPPEQE